MGEISESALESALRNWDSLGTKCAKARGSCSKVSQESGTLCRKFFGELKIDLCCHYAHWKNTVIIIIFRDAWKSDSVSWNTASPQTANSILTPFFCLTLIQNNLISLMLLLNHAACQTKNGLSHTPPPVVWP